MSDAILAVDFGTSNSLAGLYFEGQHQILKLDPAAEDATLMRTLLYFPDGDHCFYGQEAINEYIQNSMEGRLFRSFKAHLPNQQYLGTFLDNRVLTLETLIGTFLLELKKRAEKILQTKVEKVVIGKPARYSMDPVQDGFALHRMKKAIEFAGFKEYRFVPEPLGAAFDYRKDLKEERIVLVGDFGGGTSDFTLIRMGPFDFEKEHVLGIDGSSLAGDALDSLFMSRSLNNYFGAQAKYKRLMGSNLLTMPLSVMEKLNQPAHIVHLKEKDTYEFIKEVRKCTLSPKDKVDIDRLFALIEDDQIFSFFESIEKTKRNLSDHAMTKFIYDYPGIDIETQFSKKEFENWAQTPKEKIFSALDRCLQQAQLKENQVDLVCLTGGTAKVPLIREELEKRFGAEKLQTRAHFHSVLSGLIESTTLWNRGLL